MTDRALQGSQRAKALAAEPDRLVADIRKNAREQIRVQLRTFKDQRTIDLRVFASNGGDMVATPKGVAIRPELIRLVIEALERAEAEAAKEHILESKP